MRASNSKLYEKITKEQRTLLGLLGESLFGRSFEPEEGVDWSAVFSESRSQAVCLLAFQNYKQLPFSDNDLYKTVSDTVLRLTAQNMANRRSHALLDSIMRGAGIEYCILKGVSSAHYYPSPILRAMGDVDFYVNDIDGAAKALEANGFTTNDRIGTEFGHHLVFKNKKDHFELHYEVCEYPKSSVTPVLKEYMSDIIECSSEAYEELVRYRKTSDFHHGLNLLIHSQQHMTSEGIGLRHLCDWAVFVDSMSERDFTDLFKERLQRVGLWKFARIFSLASVIALGMKEADWMYEDDRDILVAEQITSDIIYGGNFGRKDDTRRYEAMMISLPGKDGKKRGSLGSIIGSLNRLARCYWPVVKKLPFLYPLFWLFLVVRLLFRIATGKRSVSVLSVSSKKSRDRASVYSELRLFETEQHDK